MCRELYAEYGQLYEPIEVSCDGYDNDCDGSPDTGLPSPPCANQEGVCFGSVTSCSGGAWNPCTDADFGPWYEPDEATCGGGGGACGGATYGIFSNTLTGPVSVAEWKNTWCPNDPLPADGNCFRASGAGGSGGSGGSSATGGIPGASGQTGTAADTDF